MSKKVPRLKTDEEAEAFLEQDLSNLDFPQFKPARFEFEKKSERINMRVPKPLAGRAQGAGQPPRTPLHPVHPRTHGVGTCPARMRAHQPGVIISLGHGKVRLREVPPADVAYLRALRTTLGDWDSPEDAATYDDL